MLSIRLNVKWHAIIATAGTARRNTTGRSGPTVSEPAAGVVAVISGRSAAVACYQRKRIIGAFRMAGDDEIGDLLRRVGEHERLCESVFDTV